MTYIFNGKGPFSNAIRDLDRRVTALEPRIGPDGYLQKTAQGVMRRPKKQYVTQTTASGQSVWQ